MHSHVILAHDAFSAGGWAIWEFSALVLLILFITLVVSDGPKNKDQ
jgi:hypothetical protein